MLINFNHLKTFYNALVQKLKGFRGNWDQNDPSADDYIKNRPFYSEGVQETIIVNQLTSEQYNNGNKPACNFVPGQSYVVIWNGVEYPDLICYEDDGYHCIGWAEDIPFLIDDDGGNSLFIGTNDDIYTVSILIRQEVVHKLDKKFIDVDMPDNVITEDSLFPILENNLAPVAFTNNYSSLSGKPTIYTDVVRYGESQSLTDDQKAVARTNIGIEISNLGEADPNKASYVSGIIRQESLPEGYPYITYIAGEMITDLYGQRMTLTKQPNGQYRVANSNGTVGEYVSGVSLQSLVLNEKYMFVFDNGSFVVTFVYKDNMYYFVTEDGNNFGSYNSLGTARMEIRIADFGPYCGEGTFTFTFHKVIKEYTHIDDHYLPDTITYKSDFTWNNLLDKPEYSIVLKDVDTSYHYNVFVKNGTLATSIACVSIRIDSIPDKEYLAGNILDLSDATVIAIYEDGSERQVTNFTYPEFVPSVSSPEVVIHYTEFGCDFTAIATLTSIKSMSEVLVDFEYTANADGTYTLTDWKGTLNGEPSTELVIPAHRLINL